MDKQTSGVRVRFAPSPTGYLHLGGARTALYDWLFARKMNGTFILRIEDTDRSRLVPDSVDDLLEGMKWLGIEPDQGPFFQSERREIYRARAMDLLSAGAAYRCFCTSERLGAVREERKKAGLRQGYDRQCRGLSDQEVAERMEAGQGHVIRLKMPLSGSTSFVDELRGKIVYDNAELEDIVLLKSDGWPTYHLANVVDDHDMGITHIMRADEWLPSVPYHVVMYAAFGWEPPIFVHLPVILSPDGRGKMSKRYGAFAVKEVRAAGFLPEAVVNYLALLGWSPGDNREIMTLPEMVEAFSLSSLSRRGAVFDHEKLRWMNGEYIRSLPEDDLFQRVLPFFRAAGITDEPAIRKVVRLYQDRAKTLADFVQLSSYLFAEPDSYDPQGVAKHFSPEVAHRLLQLADRLEALPGWSEAGIEGVVRSLAEEMGLGAGKLIHPTRLAISGTTVGPGLFALMEAMGPEACISRIRKAAGWIAENFRKEEARQ